MPERAQLDPRPGWARCLPAVHDAPRAGGYMRSAKFAGSLRESEGAEARVRSSLRTGDA